MDDDESEWSNLISTAVTIERLEFLGRELKGAISDREQWINDDAIGRLRNQWTTKRKELSNGGE